MIHGLPFLEKFQATEKYPFKVFDQKGWMAQHREELDECTHINEVFRYVTSHHPSFGMSFDIRAVRVVRDWACDQKDVKELAVLADAVAQSRPDLLREQANEVESKGGWCDISESGVGGMAAVYCRYPEDEHILKGIQKWQLRYRLEKEKKNQKRLKKQNKK